MDYFDLTQPARTRAWRCAENLTWHCTDRWQYPFQRRLLEISCKKGKNENEATEPTHCVVSAAMWYLQQKYHASLNWACGLQVWSVVSTAMWGPLQQQACLNSSLLAQQKKALCDYFRVYFPFICTFCSSLQYPVGLLVLTGDWRDNHCNQATNTDQAFRTAFIKVCFRSIKGSSISSYFSYILLPEWGLLDDCLLMKQYAQCFSNSNSSEMTWLPHASYSSLSYLNWYFIALL
jgi:hypothetical protein